MHVLICLGCQPPKAVPQRQNVRVMRWPCGVPHVATAAATRHGFQSVATYPAGCWPYLHAARVARFSRVRKAAKRTVGADLGTNRLPRKRIVHVPGARALRPSCRPCPAAGLSPPPGEDLRTTSTRRRVATTTASRSTSLGPFAPLVTTAAARRSRLASASTA
jgi:hypothetical protein